MINRPSTRARVVGLLVAVLLAAAAVSLAAAVDAPRTARAAGTGLRVRGNQLVDGPGAGHPVGLRGVNRSGLEFACIQGWGYFSGPHPRRIDDPGMLAAMQRWDIDVVRVPLNEDCWLNLHMPRGGSVRGGAAYRRIVVAYVQALHRAGFAVVLDLHWTGAGDRRATGQTPMADAAHAPQFWRSVAATFRADHELLFDLFNEPHGISWSCWRGGCEVPAGGGLPAYRAAGMQQLVDAVRSTGATQPLLLGGLGYAGDLRGWSAHLPHDPEHSLVASQHIYGGQSPCNGGCERAILRAGRHHPVLLGELGETDCADGYINDVMAWADRHRIGYLGWTWDATDSGWSCRTGPALITDYAGDPTAFGVGLRDHLQALARAGHRPG